MTPNPMTPPTGAALLASAKKELESIRDSLDTACGIIETGDYRLLAQDGPVNGQPPIITLTEWRRLFVALDRARTKLRESAALAQLLPEEASRG